MPNMRVIKNIVGRHEYIEITTQFYLCKYTIDGLFKNINKQTILNLTINHLLRSAIIR